MKPSGFPDRFAVGSDTDAEDATVRLRSDEIAHPSAESLGKLLGMRGRDYRTLGMTAEIPCREENARIGRLRTAGGHANHQPPALAALDRLEMRD